MLKSQLFHQSLRTSTSQVSLSIYDEDCVRQPPEMIRQNKFTKTYAKLASIPLQVHVPTLITRNIQHLYLSHNCISSLEGVQNYPNLVSLNVSYNRLTLIEQLTMIQNSEILLRIGLRMNDFVYGYQDYAIKAFRNLQKIDDICVKDKHKVKEMWSKGQKIACNFLQFYIRLQRVLYFMNDLIDKSKIHQQMGLSHVRSKYPNAQLKLLFEHMTQNFIAKVSQLFMLPSDEQFLQFSSLEIFKNIQSVISVTLEENIDFKCTCRPKLPYDQEVKLAFTQISKMFLIKFSNRFNKQLQNGLKKVRTKLSKLYPNRKWQDWQLFGMVQNYLELGIGGKRISHIIDQERKKFLLFDERKNIQTNVLKGKKPKKDDTSWRNSLFSDQKFTKEEHKQNYSPNVTFLLENFGQYKIPTKRNNSKQEQNPKQQPELFFDRIPMILYDKNYAQILMQITMEIIKQMLGNYNYLVQAQKQYIQSHIINIKSKENLSQNSYDSKIQPIQKRTPISTKIIQSVQLTERQITSQNAGKIHQGGREQKMFKSTIANNSPFYTERFDQGAITTTRHYLQRKVSEISFGKANQDEDDAEMFQVDPIEPDQRKKTQKSKRNKSEKQNEVNSGQNYAIHEINLVYKVFRALKLRLLKKKKKTKAIK